ncbi:MAG: sigma 54-interacting transcriptional regulator [Coriobacteriales bacterium]|nr:sigma 54-interacting transcriptional regulator [Coriobacteriales bacterium]
MDYIDFETLEHEKHILIQDLSLDRLRWKQIEKARNEFLLHETECPDDVLSPQILESWKRSRSLAIDPDATQLCIRLNDREYQRVTEKNADLIRIAKPLLHIIEDLHLENDYIFELIETGGATLTRIGKLDLHKYIAEKSLFNESTMGTNAHSLCMRHKAAVHLMGPEHYCRVLHDLAACAAPIMDEHNEVIASLLLTQPLPKNPWSETYHNLMSHTLGLIASLASAIEYRMKCQRCVSLLKLQRSKPEPAERRPSASGDVANRTFDEILGPSEAIKSAVELAKRYATTSESILLVGESGTGKEYFAQAIHNASRPSGPFMSINCAAIPPRLIESELFGYEDGSFTGARRGGKPGKIEMAQGGTLFLDEIGDMPLELQATLLRVLEDKRVMRLGGKSYKQVDFRVMAATNRDLLEMVREKTFREDLFYRLSILTIRLPTLEERPEDKAFFARYYLDECRRKDPNGPRNFAPETLMRIEAYHWHGNVRQLKNAVFSSYFAAHGDLIQPDDLPASVRDDPRASGAGRRVPASGRGVASLTADRSDGRQAAPPSSSGHLMLREQERASIDRALAQTGSNVAQAAELLGISRATLYRRLRRR